MTLHSLAAAVLLGAAAFAAQASQVQLEALGTPTAGQSFDLQLVLEDPFQGLAADEQLLAYGFHLSFDSSLLKLDAFTPAAGWENDSGRLGAGIFSASIFPGVDNAGQGDLVLGTLHFDALGAGAAAVALATDPGDFNQGLIYLEADPRALAASTTIALSTPVPEPASGALLLGGLAALAWRRRRA